jgi:anti-sigma factor RsiW
MKLNSCAAIQSAFSDYLDGAVSGRAMQKIARHIDGDGSGESGGCEACAREFAAWRATHEAVSGLGRAKAPSDLGLKLRLAISREQVRRASRWTDRVSLAWENAVRPIVLQVSAGLVGTIVLVGSIALLAAPPQAVEANDEPLSAVTAPHYLYSTVSPGAIVTANDAAILVEASVDNTGRVYDYNIVSGPEDGAVRQQVARQLLGSVYQPASVFGLPVRGRVLVTFSGISIRG